MTMIQTDFNWAHYLIKCEVWPPPKIVFHIDWSNYSDEELLTLYQGANLDKQNDAFAEIFNRYRLTVYNYIKSKVSDEWEARAVFSDVWFKAIDKLKIFVYRGKPLEYWFRSVAYRTVQEYYCKRGRDTQKINRFVEARLQLLDNPHDPAQIKLTDELLDKADERFFEARDSLKNPLQRKIITMIYFNGITNSDQIAKKLKVKSGAIIRTYHSRALKKLTKYFKQQREER